MINILEETPPIVAAPVGLIFSTKTEIDLRELFVLGLGSKRGDSTKIGHKGSGMKFTLALLHRLGSRLEVSVGGAIYRSDTVSVSIRGQDHTLIVLRGPDNQVIETNISLVAGADTWREPWFALRELLQNCIDEGGHHSLVVGLTDLQLFTQGGTVIRIVLTGGLEQAWSQRQSWHHERNANVIYSSDSPGLYYHGFKIYSPQDKPWRYAYDVTALIDRDNLSEDRQLRNVDLSQLFRAILGASPQVPASLYGEMLERITPNDITLLLSAAYNLCSPGRCHVGGFKISLLEDAFLAKHGNKAAVSADPSDASRYYAAAMGLAIVIVSWQVQCLFTYPDDKRITFADNLVPSLEKRLATVNPNSVGMDALSKLKSALKITKRLRPDGCEVQIVKAIHHHDVAEIKAVAFAVIADNKVLIIESHVKTATLSELVNTLIEEFMHLRSRAGDCTREYQAALIAAMTELLTPRTRSSNSL